MKKCKTCGETKESTEFYPSRSYCKACDIARQRRWYRANTEKAKATATRCAARAKAADREAFLAKTRARNKCWKQRNPEKVKAQKHKHHLKGAFGLSLEEYQAAWHRQNGCCACCGRPENGKRLAVDHDHATGAMRGLLCGDCNTGIGLLGDNVAGIERALNYLNHQAFQKGS